MVKVPAPGPTEVRMRLALMRAMARPNAVIEWSGEATDRLLLVSSAPGARASVRAPVARVAALASLGLVAEHDGHLEITSAGRAWLRRQLAGNDPFLEQHRDTHRRPIVEPKGRRNLATVNDAESPLAWLRRRKDRDGGTLIDDNQFESGERLRRDYTFAALMPRVTADWSNSGAASAHSRAAAPAGTMRDDVLAAKARVHRALEAVGPELGRMLVDVCCLLKGLEMAESGQGLPKRSGKVVLQLGLTALARHYGLIAAPRRRNQGPAPTLHWGTADFRPDI